MTDTLQALLQPISADAPCGEDMVFSAEFDMIREARRHDDPHLDQGDWVTDVKEADWPRVADIATQLLRERTKDLRVAGWLTEAWAKTRGFAGLRDGLALIDSLCRQYWACLHPLPDDDDLQQRVGNLAWVLSRSQQLVREIPLTRADGAAYGAGLWDSASQLANAIRRTPQDATELARGKLTLDDFDTARRATPPAFYAELQTNVEAARQALLALETTVGEVLGDDGPAFSPMRDALAHVAELVGRFAREAGLLPRVETSAPVADPAEPSTRLEPVISALPPAAAAAPVSVPQGPAGAPQTREQALAQLREVADFFRRTEPHSPVAYLAEKAASWGEMSLHLWLRTVLKNEDALANLEELLGVPKSPDNNA